MTAQSDHTKSYWSESLRIVGKLLCIWFFVSFGCGILFKDFLDQYSIGGAPLGFWMAQQGSIYVFVALIFIYVRLMNKLENQYAASHSNHNETLTDGGENS